MLLLAEDEIEFPFSFVATAVNVYDVPFVKPVTVTGEVPVAVILPGLDVTVYEVIDFPPVAFEDIATEIAPPDTPPIFVTEVIVGACGTEVGVTEFDAELATEFPYEFVATTLKVYAVP